MVVAKRVTIQPISALHLVLIRSQVNCRPSSPRRLRLQHFFKDLLSLCLVILHLLLLLKVVHASPVGDADIVVEKHDSVERRLGPLILVILRADGNHP